MNLFIRDVVTPLRGRNPILLAVSADSTERLMPVTEGILPRLSGIVTAFSAQSSKFFTGSSSGSRPTRESSRFRPFPSAVKGTKSSLMATRVPPRSLPRIPSCKRRPLAPARFVLKLYSFLENGHSLPAAVPAAPPDE